MAPKALIVGSGLVAARAAKYFLSLGFNVAVRGLYPSPIDISIDFIYQKLTVELAEQWDIVVFATNPIAQAHLASMNAPLCNAKIVVFEKPLLKGIPKLGAICIVNHPFLFQKQSHLLVECFERSKKFTLFYGGSGPVRDFSSLLDWGVHGIVLIFKMLNIQDLKDIKLKDFHKEELRSGISKYQIVIELGEKIMHFYTGNGWDQKMTFLKSEIMEEHIFINTSNKLSAYEKSFEILKKFNSPLTISDQSFDWSHNASIFLEMLEES